MDEDKGISAIGERILKSNLVQIDQMSNLIRKKVMDKTEFEKAISDVERNCYFTGEKLSWTEKCSIGKRIGDEIVNKGVMQWICQTIIEWRETYPSEEDTCKKCLIIIQLYSWFSELLSDTVYQYPGFLDFEKFILESNLKELTQSSKTSRKKQIRYSTTLVFSLIHNASTSSHTVLCKLRTSGHFAILKDYLELTNTQRDTCDRLSIIQALVDVMDEDENKDLLQDLGDDIRNFILLLKDAIAEESKSVLGIQTWEFARVLRLLSTIDANKVRLVDLGILDVLVELSKENEEIDQYEAATTFWHLSFHHDSRKRMVKNNDVVIALLHLLQTSNYSRVKESALGTLDEMKDDLIKIDQYSKEVDTIFRKKAKGHVMISYSKEQRQILLKVKSRLETENYDVWMDVNKLSGDVYDKMAEAVDKAAVVLIGVSRSYKRNPHCRKEARYAAELDREILPLKLEPDYNGDEWLKFIIAGKYSYNFATKPFEVMIEKLLEDLKTVVSKEQDVCHQKDSKPIVNEDEDVERLQENLKPIVNKDETSSPPQEDLKPTVYNEKTVSLLREVVKPVVNKEQDVSPHEQKQTVLSVISESNECHSQSEKRDIIENFETISYEDFKEWRRKHNLPEKVFGDFRPVDITMFVEMNDRAPEAYWMQLSKLLKRYKKHERIKKMTDFTKAIKKLQM